jgi:hypothetical protein
MLKVFHTSSSEVVSVRGPLAYACEHSYALEQFPLFEYEIM